MDIFFKEYDEILLNHASSNNLLNLYKAKNSKVIYNAKGVIKRNTNKPNVRNKRIKTEGKDIEKIVKKEEVDEEDPTTSSKHSTNIWIKGEKDSFKRKKQIQIKKSVAKEEETEDGRTIKEEVRKELDNEEMLPEEIKNGKYGSKRKMKAAKDIIKEDLSHEETEEAEKRKESADEEIPPEAKPKDFLDEIFDIKEENITPQQSQSDQPPSLLKTEEKDIPEDDDILMSIINNTEPINNSDLDYETQLLRKKEEVMSQILDDSVCVSNEKKEDDNDFLLSLVEDRRENVAKSESEGSNTKSVTLKRSGIEDIDDILREADRLLKK